MDNPKERGEEPQRRGEKPERLGERPKRSRKKPGKPQQSQAELAQLRAEVTELEQENRALRQVTAQGKAPPAHARWRSVVAAVLVVAGCVLAPFSVAAVWLNQQVMDTEAYVATVAPLSRDPAIQRAVADRVAAEVFKRFNAEKLARKALPPDARFLAAPLAGAVKNFVREQVHNIIASPQFGQVWTDANRLAHKVMLEALVGQGGIVTTRGAKVELNLTPLVKEVQAKLRESGIDISGVVSPTAIPQKFTILESSALLRVKRAVQWLNSLALILPLVVLLFLGAAIGVAGNRLGAVFWTGMGLAAAMVALTVGVAVGRGQYLSATASTGLPADAAAALFDTIAMSLRTAARGIFVFGLVVAVGAVLAGQSQGAVWLRTTLAKTITELGAGFDFGPAGAWTADNKTPLRITGLVVGLLALALWSEPTAMGVLLIALVFLVYLGAIEFFGRKPAPKPAPSKEAVPRRAGGRRTG